VNETGPGNVERVPVGTPKEKKGGGVLKIIIIAVLAGGLVGGGVYFFGMKPHATPVEVAPESASGSEGVTKEAKPFGEVVQMSDIVINPAGSRRVFMVTVALEVADKEKVKEVEKRESLLRDNMITLFASQPLDVLIDIKYRQAFRARVKKIMDFQLGEGAVTRVFFEKWVFQ